ncbi:protein P200 isoform X1 [Labrus bergylta]|uniref:protein P200 isoform X1 n=1 Tax=Labrus bergylta TaxID=56723 RepID=UPI003313F0B2
MLRMLRMLMDALRKNMWIWVIVGMIFVSVVISVIFILINRCISRRARRRFMSPHLLNRRSDDTNSSNKYQERNFKAITPPLPPRTQFNTAEAQSYENLAEVPDYVQTVPDYEQDKPDYVQAVSDYEQSMPDYEQSVPDYEQSVPDYEQSVPDYEQSMPDYEQDKPDYEQSMPDYEQSMPDYEQSMPDYESIDEPPDYLKLESEVAMLPPPPYEDPDAAAETSSTEDYDDIDDIEGGVENQDDEEDYDDVG